MRSIELFSLKTTFRINTNTGKIWERKEWEALDSKSKQTCIHWNHLDPIEVPRGTYEELQKLMYFIYEPAPGIVFSEYPLTSYSLIFMDFSGVYVRDPTRILKLNI